MKRAVGGLVGLFLFVLLGAGCGEQSVAGGTTETENMLAARTIRVDSLLSDWNRLDSVATVAVLHLDSTNFDFGVATENGRDVSVERIDGPRIPFRIVFWDRLAALARIEVRLDPWLQVRGSQFRVRWGLRDSTRTDSAAVWQAIPDSQKLALTSALVDDFEHAGIQSILPDSGWWYSYASDSASQVSSPEIVAAGSGRTGNALHVSYTLADPEYGFVYTGVSLVKPRTLRSLDSIVFWARGAGSMTMAFDKLQGNGGKAHTTRTLDANWSRICLRPQDLDTADGIGGNTGWNAVRDSVTNLTFFASHGTDLWLDDIRLYGVDRDGFK